MSLIATGTNTHTPTRMMRRMTWMTMTTIYLIAMIIPRYPHERLTIKPMTYIRTQESMTMEIIKTMKARAKRATYISAMREAK